MSNIKAFSHLDLDPRAVADQLVRELATADIAALLARADQWLSDVCGAVDAGPCCEICGRRVGADAVEEHLCGGCKEKNNE